jgi:hypothetical protein
MKFFQLFMIILSVISIDTHLFSMDNNEFTNFDTYVFANNAIVRNNPDIDSTPIDNLTAGHKVTILGKTGTLFTLNGITDYWYKIKYISNNARKVGYIWAGLVSVKSIPYKDNNILLGALSYKKGSGLILSIKIFSGNNILSKISFKVKYPPIDNVVEFPKCNYEFLDDLGLDSFDHILKISFIDIPDYELKSRIIIGIRDNDVFYIAEEISQGQAGVGSKYSSYIFPNEKGGQPNRIVYNYREYKFNESKMKDVLIKDITYKYIWENNSLKKTAE